MCVKTLFFQNGLIALITVIGRSTFQLGCCLLLSSLLVQSVDAGSIISSKYDLYFKQAIIFLPVGTDWRMLKAQCYQESRLNPMAVSPVGAYGVCQFMPGTASDLKGQYPELENFWLPEVSITAAAIYMTKMHRIWSAPRSREDRYKLSLASYNAGAGHLIKAQRLSGGRVEYSNIIAELHKVTGDHSKETINYVQYITVKWYPMALLD